MSEAEIRWIVENLFIGNKLARGLAHLDERTHVDLRNIQSPIIVFASHGDDITPPHQALGWIADLYKNADEIRVRGQRIIYTVHQSVGHLGIFVSSEVAGREHQSIFSTLKAIESMAPGLYEMRITDETGEGVDKRYRVAFEERAFTVEEGLPRALPQARAVHAVLFDPMRSPLQRGQVALQPHPQAGVCRQPCGRQPEASPHADARRQPGRVRRGKADQAAQQPTSIARRRRKIVVDDQRAGDRLNRRCACGQASSRVPSAPRRWPQRPASTWPARGGCRRWRRA
jgi:hypothetical protein